MGKKYNGRGAMKPVPREVEGIRFDSELEASTYEFIRLVIPSHRILCHQPVLLCPENDYFKRLDWKVDFTVLSPCGSKRIYIESKGLKELSFQHQLQWMATLHPHVIDNLLLVSYEDKLTFGKKLETIERFKMLKILKLLEAANWQGISPPPFTP